LSGGGIRSATFNLGLIQLLNKVGLLKKVDYLSTVSGGGYIGGCFTSLMSSEINDKNSTAENIWSKDNFPLGINYEKGIGEEKPPLKRLRYFSNFLTAEGGIVDKYLRPLMVILRGLILNFILILPYILAISLLLTAILNIKSFIPGNSTSSNDLFFDLKEFKQTISSLNLVEKKYEQYVTSNTKYYSVYDFTQREIILSVPVVYLLS
jgi:hypothetical protein